MCTPAPTFLFSMRMSLSFVSVPKPVKLAGVALRAFEHLRVHQLVALRAGQRPHLRLCALRAHALAGSERRVRINGRRALARGCVARRWCAGSPALPGRATAPGGPRHLPRHGDLDIGPGGLLVDGREVVVVDVGRDRLRARVLHDMRDRHLRLAGRQPDDLRIDVAEVDRRFVERVRELHHVTRRFDVPLPAIGDDVRTRMVVGSLVALQDADAGLDEQAARRHVVVAEGAELFGGTHHRGEIGGDDVLSGPFVAEVVDVGDLRTPGAIVFVALVLEASRSLPTSRIASSCRSPSSRRADRPSR